MSKRQGPSRKWLTDYTVISVVLSAVVIGLAITMSFLQGLMGAGLLILVIAVLLVTFAAVSVPTHYYASLPLQDLAHDVREDSRRLAQEVHKDVAALTQNMESIATGGIHCWLLPQTSVIDIEATIDTPDIWVVSLDLVYDTNGGAFEQVVEANLKRGVTYTYFVPDTDKLKGRVRHLRERHHNHVALKVRSLETEFFLLVHGFDFTLYNPFGRGDGPRKAYMGLPIDPCYGRRYVEVSRDLVDTLFGHLLPKVEPPWGSET